MFVGLGLACAPFLGIGGKGVLEFLVAMGVVAGLGGGFVMGLAVLILRSTARKVDEQLACFRRGEYLAHWTYRPHEWRSFSEAEWRRTKGDAWLPVVVALVILGFFLSVAPWTKMKQDDVVLLGCIGLPLVGFALFGLWVLRASSRGSYRRALRRLGETYIGPRGVYYNGWFHTWASFGVGLRGVRLVGGTPAVVEFDIGPTEALQGLAATRGTRLSGSTLRVLVPAGREEEAARVVETIAASLHRIAAARR